MPHFSINSLARRDASLRGSVSMSRRMQSIAASKVAIAPVSAALKVGEVAGSSMSEMMDAASLRWYGEVAADHPVMPEFEGTA